MSLPLEDSDLAAGQGMVKFFCNKMAARGALTAKQEQSRNMQIMKPKRFENIVFDTLQFAMNGMRCGDSLRPMDSSLHCGNLMGGAF